jgi:hypothetical protein
MGATQSYDVQIRDMDGDGDNGVSSAATEVSTS